MQVLVEPAKPGQSVPVRSSFPYELPRGLSENSVVTVKGFKDCRYVVQDAAGAEWHLPHQCMVTPHRYRVGNRWLRADDPQVAVEWQRLGIQAKIHP